MRSPPSGGSRVGREQEGSLYARRLCGPYSLGEARAEGKRLRQAGIGRPSRRPLRGLLRTRVGPRAAILPSRHSAPYGVGRVRAAPYGKMSRPARGSLSAGEPAESDRDRVAGPGPAGRRGRHGRCNRGRSPWASRNSGIRTSPGRPAASGTSIPSVRRSSPEATSAGRRSRIPLGFQAPTTAQGRARTPSTRASFEGRER